MARSVERLSSSDTTFMYRAEPATPVRNVGPLSFSRVLSQLQDPVPEHVDPAVSHESVLNNTFIRPVSVEEVNGILYGWSYHDLIDGTMSFKTTGEASEEQKRFMISVSKNFNNVEAPVIHEVFSKSDIMPRSMSMTFVEHGILYLLSKRHAGDFKGEEFMALLDKVNAMYDGKHKQLNEEWLALVV